MNKKDHTGKEKIRPPMVTVSIEFKLRMLKILRGDRKHNGIFR